MITNEGAVAVVSWEGRIIDFGPEGGKDELNAIIPILSTGIEPRDTDLPRIEAAAGGNAIRIERAVFGKQTSLITWVYFRGKNLRVESVAASTGDDPALIVTLGERAWWGNVPTWVEGAGFINKAGTHRADFIGRESSGMAYALCSDSGKLTAYFGAPDLPGFYEEARTGEDVVPVPPRGVSATRAVTVAYSTSSLGEAVLALPCVRNGGVVQATIPTFEAVGAKAQVARCGSQGPGSGGGSPFALFGVERKRGSSDDKRAIELPSGCYQVRLSAPGYTPGPWIAGEGLAAAVTEAALPRAGELHFEVTEGGNPVPARILVRGVNVPDPNWGDDAYGGAALNVVHAERGVGERPVPPGTYKVMITRGFEYTAFEKEISVVANQTVTVRAPLERVVDTKGWIAADLHLHAMPSMDAPAALVDRVRSLAAAGVEVAVATDHNVVTDYKPAISSLGLSGAVASIIGDEVTTKDLAFGHFNVFPLAAGSPPLPWRGTLPKTVFAAARASAPYGKDTILQVNHPRMGGIGYFDVMRLDATDIAGWMRRSPVVDMSFDALEVFNGDHYANIPKVDACLKDWYALLNAGLRVTATGNSDSHKITFHEPGAPRTLVAVASDDPAAFDERAFIDAVRAGRVVVSSGPFLRLSVNGKGIGATAPAGAAEIVVSVDAPPWVDVDRVEILRRGELLWSSPVTPGKRPASFRVSETLKKGDWLIAVARGSKPMTFLYRPDAKPFAFTNPIWIE